MSRDLKIVIHVIDEIMKKFNYQNRRKFFKSISISAAAGFLITKIPFAGSSSGNTGKTGKKPEVRIHPQAVKRKK